MEHAHLEIASGILNIVLATVALLGVAHDATVWIGVPGAGVVVTILVTQMSCKLYSI